MKTYTITDLKKRYNITSRQGVSQFVQAHLPVINANGEHAKKTSGKWVFDEAAIEILDNLRSASGVTVIEEDSEKVAELKAQNEQLKEMLIAIQSKLIETQDNERAIYQQLMSTQKQLAAIQNQLMTTKVDKVEIESKLREQLAAMRVDTERQKQRIAELEKASERGKQAEQELSNMRQRSLLGRLLNKDL